MNLQSFENLMEILISTNGHNGFFNYTCNDVGEVLGKIARSKYEEFICSHLNSRDRTLLKYENKRLSMFEVNLRREMMLEFFKEECLQTEEYLKF